MHTAFCLRMPLAKRATKQRRLPALPATTTTICTSHALAPVDDIGVEALGSFKSQTLLRRLPELPPLKAKPPETATTAAATSATTRAACTPS